MSGAERPGDGGTQRLFVAVELDEAVGRAMDRVREAMAGVPSARWVRADVAHLTLRFIGDTGAEDRERLSAALAQAAPGFRRFEFTVAGLGAFPAESRARVLWAGVGDGARELVDLAGKVDEAVRSVTQGGEERVFAPHITIARLKTPANLEKLEVFSGLKETVLGRCRATRFVLFSSRLTPAGPVHERVRAYDLS